MTHHTLETDYLVIGCGAAGMAFTDALISDSDAEVVMLDRRHAPGGHWNDAYPFVRLHQPSRYYGVNSLPLGGESIERSGPESGMYERASGAAITAYYEQVMNQRLLASGRVRFFPQSEYLGDHRFVSTLSGATFEVKLRKKLVDARYLSPSIPFSSPPKFEIEPGVDWITVNQLADLRESPEKYVIIGAGKTGADACVWLLQNGVSPTKIRWIKPREAWFLNRAYFQPGELVGKFFLGLALQMEAAAKASSVDDLFERLEAAEQLRRVDPSVQPTMYKGATIGDWEIDLLRGIEDVVRLGHVRRLEHNRIVLDQGTIPTGPGHLHVHCAADGLPRPPKLPIFGDDRITLQSIRPGLVPFNAAMAGFIEATRRDDADKNRLCPPNPFPDAALDWAKMTLIGMRADYAWSKEPDIAEWLERSRLNPARGIRERMGEAEVQQAMLRFVENVRPGLARLAQLIEQV